MASYDASQQNHSSPTPSSVALSTDWPSGRNELAHAKKAGCWKDGRRVGRGFPQPCLQAHHARAIARGKKTVEGRPGGGWLKNVQADDYINFQVPRGRRLIVRVLRATFRLTTTPSTTCCELMASTRCCRTASCILYGRLLRRSGIYINTRVL